MSINIIDAKEANLQNLSVVSAQAYYNDPLFMWMYPGDRINHKFLFMLGLKHDFRYGVVHIGKNFEGFTSWVPYE